MDQENTNMKKKEGKREALGRSVTLASSFALSCML